MEKGAEISNDNKYRYLLWRIWEKSLPLIAFIGLNPSTADDKLDDPTIIRCINFSKEWGYGGFYMLNLFAFRSTDPLNLKKEFDSIGLENEKYIKSIIHQVNKVICIWGNHGIYLNQNKKILNLIKNPYCLKINKSGEPAHPLYLKKDLLPIEYKVE